MKIIETDLAGLLVIEPAVFGDPRGFFHETWREDRYREAGVGGLFVQDNFSRSAHRVLRGLHFQKKHPQAKLVFVTRGEVFDVAVDLRPGSPTFGRWYGLVLSDKNHRQVWVPAGMAHGFYVLSDEADFIYKCTDYYHPEDEGGLLYSDTDLGIDWPAPDPILNERDRNFPRLRDLAPDDLPAVTR
ncbi:MAG: dTDP-4-dehydrorhamnose 3,5-epimerase [Thermodesulfobacteriota bacterium]